jgi:GLPGLI family protein
MKRILLILGVLISIIAAHSVLAQVTEGVITYDVKVNLHRRIPPEREQMKARVPEFRSSKEQLFFTSTESLSKPLIEDEDEEPMGGGPGPRMRFQMPNAETYFSQQSGVMITKQEFNGKEYLIDDSLKIAPWKFGTEIKTIQGYECKQAYYTDESIPDRKQEITAWYTDKIRPFLGPDRFNTLPGTILALDINNGERVTVASKIEMRPLKKNELKAPTKGTKITRAEFRAMMEEQMKRMRENGGVIIRN